MLYMYLIYYYLVVLFVAFSHFSTGRVSTLLITLPIAHWCQPVIKLEQRHWALSYHIRVMIILGGIVMMK